MVPLRFLEEYGGVEMAQIFIGHSRKDEGLRTFFANAFAGTNVKAFFAEFEKIVNGEMTPNQIKQAIQQSQAIFIILSPNVQDIPHTRDWIVSEAAAGSNVDVWVFEQEQDTGKITISIPFLRQYMTMKADEGDYKYLRQIIESYCDHDMIKTVAATTAAGAGTGYLLGGKNKAAGTLAGALIGLAGGYLYSKGVKKRPVGISVICPKCRTRYSVHLSSYDFRCPVCNENLRLQINPSQALRP